MKINIKKADENTPAEVFLKLSEIDKKCVGADGWSADSIKSEAEKNNGIVLYIELEESPIALIFGYFAADEADITSVAVAPGYRRRGYAEMLIGEFENQLPDITASIFLEVRESNLPAISLYQKQGFAPISVRKNFYSEPDENAVVMQKILNKEG